MDTLQDIPGTDELDNLEALKGIRWDFVTGELRVELCKKPGCTPVGTLSRILLHAGWKLTGIDHCREDRGIRARFKPAKEV